MVVKRPAAFTGRCRRVSNGAVLQEGTAMSAQRGPLALRVLARCEAFAAWVAEHGIPVDYENDAQLKRLAKRFNPDWHKWAWHDLQLHHRDPSYPRWTV